MAIDLHASNPLPLYVRMASVLRERITTGEWGPGSQIPTIDELRDYYQVAEITLRQAIRILANEGLVLSRRGKGTFVLDRPTAVMGRTLIDSALEQFSELEPFHTIVVLQRDWNLPPPAWDWRFGTPAEHYVRITKQHIEPNGLPYAHFVIHIETSLYRRLPQGADTRDKLIRLVRQHGGVRLHAGRERLTMGVAEFTEAEWLQCTPGLPIARIKRVFVDESGIALFYGSILFRGDRLVLERDFASDGLRPE